MRKEERTYTEDEVRRLIEDKETEQRQYFEGDLAKIRHDIREIKSPSEMDRGSPIKRSNVSQLSQPQPTSKQTPSKHSQGSKRSHHSQAPLPEAPAPEDGDDGSSSHGSKKGKVGGGGGGGDGDDSGDGGGGNGKDRKKDDDNASIISMATSLLSMTCVGTLKMNDVAKKMIAGIKKYDRKGGAIPLEQFLEAWDEFRELCPTYPLYAVLKLMKRELVDAPYLWWKKNDMDKMENWDEVKQEFRRQWIDDNLKHQLRTKLHLLMMEGTPSSVTAYNSAFDKLTMQMTTLVEAEEKQVYLNGLRSDVRKQVEINEEYLKTVKKMQETALRQERILMKDKPTYRPRCQASADVYAA